LVDRGHGDRAAVPVDQRQSRARGGTLTARGPDCAPSLGSFGGGSALSK
jgi:hypothetical protein